MMEFLTYQPLLWVIVLVGLVLVFRRSLVDRPRWMKFASFACRVVGLLLLILAICRPYFLSEGEQLHLAMLVDVSESMDVSGMRAAKSEVVEAIDSLESGDSYSLFVFANGLREMDLESLDAFITSCEEGLVDTDFRSASAWADAMLTARLSFPSGKSRRMLIFSDGIANEGGLSDAIEQLTQEEIELSFSRKESLQVPEAAVVKLEPASKIAFEGEIVRLNAGLRANRDMSGRLRVLHKGVVVNEEEVMMQAGQETNVNIDVEMTSSGASRWVVELIPEADHFPINNQMATTIEVKGQPRVLVLHENSREMRPFSRAMKEQGIVLDVRGARGLPDTLEGIMAFDAVVLSDVPATDLRPVQMEYLKRYVSEFGGGLAMMGSENSFGLGGYYQTPVEEVLPLTSRFEKEKQKPSLAMVLVIDKSGSMSGVPIALARQAAKSAADLLSSNDQIAVIGFDSQPVVICDMTSAGNKGAISNSIDSLAAGGGTNLYPAMLLGNDMLSRASAKIKHMIILSDGQSAGGDYLGLAQDMSNRGMTVSTVALGSNSARALMANIAQTGRGRYYETTDPASVPQIFTKETMQASKSAIKEDLYGAILTGDHPVMSGYEDANLPLVLGYVMTRANPTAQVLLIAETGDPLLAITRYGLGSGLAYTSDLTERWGSEWLSWSGGSKFWAQVLRGILKKETGAGMSLFDRVEGDSWHFEVRRHDASMRPVNQINWTASVVDQAGESKPVELKQVGLGRYEGMVDLNGMERASLNIRDADYDRSRVLRWQRPFPEEYRLGAEMPDSVSGLEVYESGTIREGIESVPTRRSATPAFVILAMLFMMAGIALRRL
ncbi:MAG: VWA domain-containing protein [Opitutales bacterium]